MKLGLSALSFGPKVRLNLDLIRRAEELGFDSAWTAEAYGSDAVTPAAWILSQTTKIKVGTAIMQMPARSPAMTAMTAKVPISDTGIVIAGMRVVRRSCRKM